MFSDNPDVSVFCDEVLYFTNPREQAVYCM